MADNRWRGPDWHGSDEDRYRYGGPGFGQGYGQGIPETGYGTIYGQGEIQGYKSYELSHSSQGPFGRGYDQHFRRDEWRGSCGGGREYQVGSSDWRGRPDQD